MSSAKAEKVVNPPQNPVMRRTFSSGVMTCVFSIRPKSRPIMKQPITLTRNVPIGKTP